MKLSHFKKQVRQLAVKGELRGYAVQEGRHNDAMQHQLAIEDIERELIEWAESRAVLPGGPG